jgi:hypothetical protein
VRRQKGIDRKPPTGASVNLRDRSPDRDKRLRRLELIRRQWRQIGVDDEMPACIGFDRQARQVFARRAAGYDSIRGKSRPVAGADEPFIGGIDLAVAMRANRGKRKDPAGGVDDEKPV